MNNYQALKNLLITHRNKIDVIYIDPPYGCNDMGEFAQTNYVNNITRDNLLSMLEPRLRLARDLLNDSGVIFCSIDDKNQAYIKCLFDDVFGENNFIANLIWHARRGGGNDVKHVAIDHEYIITYSKNKDQCLLIGKVKGNESFKLEDKWVKERGKYNLQQFDWASLTYTLSLDYPIISPDGKEIYPGHVDKKEWLKRRKDKSKRNDWRWMMSEETFKNAKKNDFIIFDKNKNGEWNVRVKTYQFVDYKLQLKTRLLKLRSILTSTTTQDGRKCLEELDIKTFDYPKPPKLISDLLKCFDNQNATVLDFFAGSGTTGQSVIESNQEDKGKRKFILCNNNDKDDRNPNGIAYDTTYNRLRKIVNNDSLNVYTIETNNCISKQIFEKINPEDYDINDKKTIKQKIEWICQNFDTTMDELRDKE